MEIKYTLEIVTKDIQDIGKLVENLHNSPAGSTLELDLALSKLRNVYDILNVIRTDITTPGHELNKSQVQKPAPEPVVEAPAPRAEVPEPVAEVPDPVVAAPEPVVEVPEPVAQIVEPVAEVKNTGIIAEKFKNESSINENLAGAREKDMESKMILTPIENIGKNIGINDRFLIIRELFDGDSDGFGKLIKELDAADNYEAASQMLRDQFKNNSEHEGVLILNTLVKRRFINS